ncbi:MAG: twin-arginine translocation signal domain-containing protein, partial [Thermoanaerobaculum sp.]
MGEKGKWPTTYEVFSNHGVSRRDFLRFCTVTAAALGLPASQVARVVEALETKPRLPVIWMHGLECTCCSE